jgi:uncharacterized repeat protein (TIGR01451 family)
VGITKAVEPPGSVDYHGTATYTILLENPGVADAAGSRLTDTLPASVAFVGWVVRPAGAAESGGEVTWSGTVTAGGTITFTFVVTHVGGYGEVFTNTARYEHATLSRTAQVTLSVPGPPQVSLDPPSLDFGYQAVDTTGPAQLVMLTNTGASPLAVAAVANSGDFTHTHTCPPGLPVGETCTITVCFQPATVGARTGVLTVTTNAAGSPHTVSLSGLGAVPSLSVGKAVVPEVNVAYHGAVTYVIQLENDGPVDAANTRLTDTLPVSVTLVRWLVRPPGTSVSGGRVTWNGTVSSEEPVILAFMAAHSGGYGEVVTNAVTYCHASGCGTASAAFQVPGPPRISLAPVSLDWGEQLVGASVPSQMVTLTNTGESPLVIAAVASGGAFTSIHACPASLPAGTGCTISVGFGPPGIGIFTGALTITTNVPGSPHVVSLTGVGVAPDLTISKTVTPTTALPGQVVTYTVSFSNTGPYTATDVLVTDVMSDGQSGSSRTWPVVELGSGAHGMFVITRAISLGLPSGWRVVNTASITSATFEPITRNNGCSATVTVANAPPFMLQGTIVSVTMSEEGAPIPFDLTLYAADPNGDPLAWHVEEGAGHGTVTLSEAGVQAAVAYTPDLNYNGADQFTVQVADGHGATGTIAVWVTVLPVNDAPFFSSTPILTATEDVAYTYTVTVDDVDAGDLLTLTAPTLPTWLTFTPAEGGGLLAGRPTNNEVGQHAVTLYVQDRAGASDAQTPTITVINVNDAPVLLPIGDKTVQAGTLLTFGVVAEDVDGPRLDLAATSLPPGARFITATGLFTWTPGCEASGVHTTTFTASDGALSDEETIRITVVDTCVPPPTLYLPLVVRGYAAPQPHPLLGPFPGIPSEPASAPGMVFYTSTLSLADPLPAGGRFCFSGAPDRRAPFTVDDRLALTRAGQDVFSYSFSAEGAPPEAAIVEVPRQVVTEIAAGGVILEYRDVYGVLIAADEMWLVWVPEGQDWVGKYPLSRMARKRQVDEGV